MVALTAVGAHLHLPLPYVPITLQPLMVCLAGSCLGPGLGAASQAVYVLAGLAGMPLFVGGGGPQYLLEPTFGYLAGFPLAAWITGRVAGRSLAWPRLALAHTAGLLALYAVGVPWLCVSLQLVTGQPLTPAQTAWLGLAPWPKDVLLGLGGAWVATRVRRHGGIAPA